MLLFTAALVCSACFGLVGTHGEDAVDMEDGDEACGYEETLCSGACVNVMTDPDNCGSCGHRCDSGEICYLGTCMLGCVDECMMRGGSRCAVFPADYIERCGDRDLDGCLEWSDPGPCPEGGKCLDGSCVQECTDGCEEPGATQCTADEAGYETCGDYNDDGCLAWGNMQACGERTTCVDGQCVSTCSECPAIGAVSCSADGWGYLVCDDYNHDGCLELGEVIPCADQEQCLAGDCMYVGPLCGNGYCEYGESCDSCPSDCGECSTVCPDMSWDLEDDFSVLWNAEGVWGYGFTEIDGSGFTLGAPYSRGGMQGWSGPYSSGSESYPYVVQNRTAGPIDFDGATYSAGEIGLHPSSGGKRAAVRWMSPIGDPSNIDARFYSKGPGMVDIKVLWGSRIMYEADLASGEEAVFSDFVWDPEIVFTVGYGSDASFEGDVVGLSLTARKTEEYSQLFNDVITGCNPAGEWSLGYTSSLGSFTPYTYTGWREIINPYWSRSGPLSTDGLQSYVWRSFSADVIDDVCSFEIALHPGCFGDVARCGEEWAVVRWTSPYSGEITMSGTISTRGGAEPDLDIVLTSGGETRSLWHRENTTAFYEYFELTGIFLQEGDTIDTVVGDAFMGSDTPIELEMHRVDAGD